jgi:hypothetical protein
LLSLTTALVVGYVSYLIAAKTRDVFGVALFVGVPFGMGFLMSMGMSYGRKRSLRTAIGYGFFPLFVSYMLLIILGWEGVACLIMASPIMGALCLFGSILGWHAASTQSRMPATLGVFVAPVLLAFDLASPPLPAQRSVVSEVTIRAAPETVWKNVVSFPPIDSPPPAVFAITAMPLEARIDGAGPGALRRCIFTNGTFEEPIETWLPGRELTFGVRAEPKNLEPYIQVTRGQFLLIPNPDGTTTLRGTTWYELRVFPASYFSLWSQTLLHAIHMRVLDHVKRISEGADPGAARSAALPPPWMKAVNQTCACTRTGND